MMPFGHPVVIWARKERRSKGKCHPCLNPFIREAKFFQKCQQQASSCIYMMSSFASVSWWVWANEGPEQRLEGEGWEDSFPVPPLCPLWALAVATSFHNCSSSWAPSSMAPALSGLWEQHSITCLLRSWGGNGLSLQLPYWYLSPCPHLCKWTLH